MAAGSGLGGRHLDGFGHIGITLHESAFCAHPSRDSGALLALEQIRIRIAERCDCELGLVTLVAESCSSNHMRRVGLHCLLLSLEAHGHTSSKPILVFYSKIAPWLENLQQQANFGGAFFQASKCSDKF